MAARRVSPRLSSSATTSKPRIFSRSLPRWAPGGRLWSSRGVMKCSSSAMILILKSFDVRYFDAGLSLGTHYRAAPPSANQRYCIAARSQMHLARFGLACRYGPAFHVTVVRMSDVPIVAIEFHHVALPTRLEHKWTGLTEPIGGYVLVKMIDAAGAVGWGEAPALKDWGGEFGRYFGESPATTLEVVARHLAPAVKRCLPGEIAELHARMD